MMGPLKPHGYHVGTGHLRGWAEKEAVTVGMGANTPAVID